MKKQFYLFLLLITLATQAEMLIAQVPQGISYQAIARDQLGQPMPNKTVQIRFSVLQGTIMGNPVYVEEQSAITNTFGLFMLAIGQGTPSLGTFNGIDWAQGNKFLKVEIDQTLQGTTQLLAVPYAMYAERTNLQAGAGIGVNGNTITNTGDINPNDDIVIGSVVGGDLSGTLPNPIVAKLQGQPVATQVPTTNQVLQYDGSQWKPANITTGGVYTAGTGIGISGNTINNTGLLNTSTASGDVTGTFSNLQIASGAVGSTEIINGSITAADLATGVIPTALPPNGAASGDLNGTYPAPVVDGLQGRAVSSTAPTSSQLLQWNGSAWAPVSQWVNSGSDLYFPNRAAIGASAPHNITGFAGTSAHFQVDGQLYVGGNIGSGGSQSGLPFQFGDANRALWIGYYKNDVQPSDYGVIYGDYVNTGGTKDQFTLNIVSGDNKEGSDDLDDAVFVGNINYANSTKEGITVKSGNLGLGSSFPHARLQVTNGNIYIETINNGIILKSPSGVCYRQTIDNAGNWVKTQVACP